MQPQISASSLIVLAITLTGFCSASPLFLRDALPLPGAQARNAVAATETGVPEQNTTTNSTAISYTASSTSTGAIATSEPPATTAGMVASSVCFPMMAQVDAINSCGKRYG